MEFAFLRIVRIEIYFRNQTLRQLDQKLLTSIAVLHPSAWWIVIIALITPRTDCMPTSASGPSHSRAWRWAPGGTCCISMLHSNICIYLCILLLHSNYIIFTCDTIQSSTQVVQITVDPEVLFLLGSYPQFLMSCNPKIHIQFIYRSSNCLLESFPLVRIYSQA